MQEEVINKCRIRIPNSEKRANHITQTDIRIVFRTQTDVKSEVHRQMCESSSILGQTCNPYSRLRRRCDPNYSDRCAIRIPRQEIPDSPKPDSLTCHFPAVTNSIRSSQGCPPTILPTTLPTRMACPEQSYTPVGVPGTKF